ncbi:acyl-CoA dehydrogenase family protein [Gimesia aquarii]|uniref:Putative acyl-CoA dehydrogenase n=1 Tax=Gimesia aquarii TaxID=2527964 RepID=A0A517X1G3_9PLAN|nr:acyl-CoA dehydrogenase family protein [Gimesia aquarii]QDU11345.1 putative acyl-CoA dehydrogenase [Gimesia aquarii]
MSDDYLNQIKPERFAAEFDALLKTVSDYAHRPETEHLWPDESWEVLKQAGVLGWNIPLQFGGADFSAIEMTYGYASLAEACLTTTFVLTQFNAACQRINWSEDHDVKARVFNELATGAKFATVGISHLTTSRQHLSKPTVVAKQTATGWLLDGFVPWVTGAVHADYIVTGGVCEDGTQILGLVSTGLQGVEVQPAIEMLSMTGSQTGPVKLNEVEIPAEHLIAGPVENVMKRPDGQGGAGSLTTSALALGVARRTIIKLKAEADKRPDLEEIYQPFNAECEVIFTDMFGALNSGTLNGSISEKIRERSNSLVLRASQALLAAVKGAGFVKGHPAERAIREAMFFLVWSCPQPVVHANMKEFACVLD